MVETQPYDHSHPTSTVPLGRITPPPTGHPGSWDGARRGEAGNGTTGRTAPMTDGKWSDLVPSPRKHDETLIIGGGRRRRGDEPEDMKGIEESHRPGLGQGRGDAIRSSPPPSPSLFVRMTAFIEPFLACALFLFALAHAGVFEDKIQPVDIELRPKSSPVVAVKNGSYEGVYSSGYDQDYFLGMRYAQVCHI